MIDPAALPDQDPTWRLIEEGVDVSREHEIESLFAISNGYLGVRSGLGEGSPLSSPAVFIAGIFGRSPDERSVPALVAIPDWLRFRMAIDGCEIRLHEIAELEHRRILDLHRGILWREWRHRDRNGRITRIRESRLASLAYRHMLVQWIELEAENYSGHWVVEGRRDGPLGRNGSLAAAAGQTDPEPQPLHGDAAMTTPGTISIAQLLPGTDHIVALAVRGSLETERLEPIVHKIQTAEHGLVERWEIDAEIGAAYRLNRFVVVRTSRDSARPGEAAQADAERLGALGLDRLVAAHIAAWEDRWRATDVELEGDERAQRALRFAGYHLIAAANPDDERVSIGARTLTGRGYMGHVFWDTEIYLLPFYTLTHPASARSLLMYRYHTLPAARGKAAGLGWQGALYAWESADTGEETTPPFVIAPDGVVIPIRNGEQEIHISAAVAYAAWQYWRWTADGDFFRDAGAEILLETARFWESRSEIGEDERYHIRHVIGPDEYHEDVDDDAYTNGMAGWNLEHGAETASLLEARWPSRWREIQERLGLSADDAQRWREIARAMYTGFDPSTGLFEQFQGYFDLEDLDLAAYEPRSAAMDVILGRERIRGTQVIKQPDVVLLLYLLWDRFPPDVRSANFAYYEPRCGHGSSLSPSIHALVAARLGEMHLAEEYFRQAAEIDLADNMGNAAGGVHAAALGGLWQAAIFGFAGLRLDREDPVTEPHLPGSWRRLSFPVRWRGRTFRVSVVGNHGEEVEP